MLRISKLTDHAIVVLAHLARTAHVCVHPASDISESTRIPLPTTQKVLKQLTREDLLVSVRGARGGYSLARDPETITVADVIAAMEGPLALTSCSLSALMVDHEGCTEESHCQVSGHWPLINSAVRSALEAVSILELSRPPRVGNSPARTLSTEDGHV